MGSVTGLTVENASQLLNTSKVDLLITGLPDLSISGVLQSQAINTLYSSHSQTSLAWILTTNNAPIRLYHTLLFTLPGTPVFNSGDEIGLKYGVS